ncbi:TrkA C-terminal domain-containing protein [Neobacillus sp. SM06]|uniref:TrkA C-terminal domain-containing protein n=1 Tax=Neobacillus sp. SM06 TaxID=3422492 RepID=UPI003D2950D2
MRFIILYIVIILAVIEINVVLFTLTGLDHRISRFQVISMLTGTGFTTGESELIIQHPIRRKLGAFLILFGAFSLAVIISSISNMLSKNLFTKEIASIAGILIVLMLILKLPSLQKKLASRFEGEIKKAYDLKDLPIRDVFLNEEEDCFAEISIHPSSFLIGKTLSDLFEGEMDLNILFIKHGDIQIRQKRQSTELQAGDLLIVYGNKPLIHKKFKAELQAAKEKEAEAAVLNPL